MSGVRLSLSAYVVDPALATRTAEQFARTSVGLALDGVDTFLSIAPDTGPED
ncbi:hypothetical protein [Nocardioides marmoraquaticus]